MQILRVSIATLIVATACAAVSEHGSGLTGGSFEWREDSSAWHCGAISPSRDACRLGLGEIAASRTLLGSLRGRSRFCRNAFYGNKRCKECTSLVTSNSPGVLYKMNYICTACHPQHIFIPYYLLKDGSWVGACKEKRTDWDKPQLGPYYSLDPKELPRSITEPTDLFPHMKRALKLRWEPWHS